MGKYVFFLFLLKCQAMTHKLRCAEQGKTRMEVLVRQE